MTLGWLSGIAARAALRRKKQHEHTLDQTTAQIATLEQQIYSIEAANINRETLLAMEKAGEAMQQIHGKLNIDKVDETMYVFLKVGIRKETDI
jgi:charged multivesicular body protein 4A/B